MNSRNTLYLTYDGLTDPLGKSQVLPYLLGLSKKGWHITVVSFEKEERFENGKKEIEKICMDNAIVWQPLIYTKRPPVLSTIMDLRKMKSVVKKIVVEKKVKIIHCRSYLPMLVALPFQKGSVKVVFDMRGLWADERVDGKLWNRKNPVFNSIFNYFKKKERLFIQEAGAIVSLTRAAIPFIREQKPKGSITVIPTAVDLDLFNFGSIQTEEKSKLKKELGLSDEFILGYSGSLGTWYLLKEMFLFFRELQKLNSKAKFFIITQDDDGKVIEIAHELLIPLENIIVKKANRTEMPLYLSLIDASVFFIQQKFSKIASSPTKLGELMAMGIPVICNDGVGDVKEIVEKYKAGIVLSSLDEGNLKRAAIKVLQKDYFNRDSMMEGAKEYYDLGLGVEVYDAIYTSLMETKH
jgi:glycosyltransferase involved in cell wall biosynthesis